MLANVYKSPKRVYFFFILLTALGIFSYLRLPVALFPDAAQPGIYVGVAYDRYTQDGFLQAYGRNLEYQLKTLETPRCKTRSLESNYLADRAHYKLLFSWGDDGKDCLREAQTQLAQLKASMPKEMADASYVWLAHNNTGFLFLQFHSTALSGAELYKILDSNLVPKLGMIKEAETPHLSNPDYSEILLEVDPLALVAHGLNPSILKNKISQALKSYGSGKVQIANSRHPLEISAEVINPEDLENILISLSNGENVYLSSLAKVKVRKSSANGIMKLNGEQAVSLYVRPAPGQNIRDMCEKVFKAIEETLEGSNLKDRVKLAVIVDPSAYIDNAIGNVMHEVWLSSAIAVLVLFLFIGSFFATFTTILEIPTSIVLSFILMKIFGVKTNLISLGGLALSVGMNVDASIVIIDNIMKKIGRKKLSFTELLNLVSEAVEEVWMPLFISTLTSLIVFIPLAFTSDLTAAILGDLAKAVIFSHGLSLFIALILVPTVRLHMGQFFTQDKEARDFFWIKWLDTLYEGYAKSVMFLLKRPGLHVLLYSLITVLFISTLYIIPSKLRREIVGKPDTDLIGVQITNSKNSEIAMMEAQASDFETMIKSKLGEEIEFVFTEIHRPQWAFLAFKLKDKKQFKNMQTAIEKLAVNQDKTRYDVFPFNPSELPIPEFPDLEFYVQGEDKAAIRRVSSFLMAELNENEVANNLSESPKVDPLDYQIIFKPNRALYANAQKSFNLPGILDISANLAIAGNATAIDNITVDNKLQSINMSYPQQSLQSLSDLKGFPVRVQNRIVALSALGDFITSNERDEILRFDGVQTIAIRGYFSEDEKKNEKEKNKKIKQVIEDFHKKVPEIASGVSVVEADAKHDLTQAISELTVAILISLFLIFLLLFIQFDSVLHSLIIMLAIPFGIVGVLLSLYIFDSTLSLNSALGIILLNGIACANSILLVEMILKLYKKGLSVEEAIMQTVRKRIRPILMTSLVTILGMFPIALGAGEGGKVLQPLGIAVCGGLWISLVFTLFVIPTLEFTYLKRQDKRKT